MPIYRSQSESTVRCAPALLVSLSADGGRLGFYERYVVRAFRVISYSRRFLTLPYTYPTACNMAQPLGAVHRHHLMPMAGQDIHPVSEPRLRSGGRG
jgi:hypothetical protein